METYGFEINQLIEEALNRINATQSQAGSFGGTKLKPKFASTDAMLGKRQSKTFSFNEVGQPGADGKRRIGFKRRDDLCLEWKRICFAIQS